MTDQSTDKPQADEPQTDQPQQDDLANLLGAMADGEHPQETDDEMPVGDDAADGLTDDGDQGGDHDEALAVFAQAAGGGEAQVDLGEAFGEADTDEAAASRKRLRRQAGTMTAKSFKPTKFHYLAIRLSVVMGILLLVPGLLALMVLLQRILPFAVPLADKKNATAFALLLMMSWPVAVGLLGGAWYFGKQLKLIEARNRRR